MLDCNRIRLTLNGPADEIEMFCQSFWGHPAYYWVPKELYDRTFHMSKLPPIRQGETYTAYNMRMEEESHAGPKVHCLNALYPVPDDVRRNGYEAINNLLIPINMRKDDIIDGKSWQFWNWGTKSEICDVVTRAEHLTLAVYEFIVKEHVPDSWVEHVSKMFPNIHFTISSYNGHILRESQIVNGKVILEINEYDESKLGYYILWAHIFNSGKDSKFHDYTLQSVIQRIACPLGFEWGIKFYNRIKKTDVDDIDIDNDFYNRKMIAVYLDDLTKAFGGAIISIFKKKEGFLNDVRDEINNIKNDLHEE